MPRSKEENSDLYKVVQSFGLLQAALDGNDRAQEGVWRTSTEEHMFYFNWEAREPSNNWGKEHYLYYSNKRTGTWNDVTKDEVGNVVCQIGNIYFRMK